MDRPEKKYRYSGLEYVTKDFTEFPDLCNMYICTYRINNTGKYPFLEFIMEYIRSSFSFPSFIYLSSAHNIEECIEKLCVNKSFRGYFTENENPENVFLFFESNEPVTDGDFFYKQDKHWTVTINEIMNQRSVCNIPIKSEIIYFFLYNQSFCFIQDEYNQVCEIPEIKYAGLCEPLLKSRTIFCIPPSEKTEIMGPYYYFTDFVGAVRNGGWSPDNKPEYIDEKLVTDENKEIEQSREPRKYKRGGVIRFALFLGNTKVPMNMPDDGVDLSQTKQELLKMDKKHRQTMRISDHDGKWTETHDSVKLGIIELDDGSNLMDSPLWVVKEYDRIVPISYHFIDKSTLGNTWTSDGNYQIL